RLGRSPSPRLPPCGARRGCLAPGIVPRAGPAGGRSMPDPGPTNGAARLSSALLDAAALRPLPDEEIIARVLEGDRACFELLMRRYNRRLFRTVRGILADDAEAEDVVQDSYV